MQQKIEIPKTITGLAEMYKELKRVGDGDADASLSGWWEAQLTFLPARDVDELMVKFDMLNDWAKADGPGMLPWEVERVHHMVQSVRRDVMAIKAGGEQ
ncbi:hypothetical protein [Thalassospira marina]|uniref:Uncharacterized protein n=1 Tax=Thalassospira marina TaxID=2048283 RepID=A0A2N3KJN9_9PROT|nr:hypothetical protein [Thalassospira marina]PKR50764.1 hypothetical protein COO20_20210 [Thalassospira marina]